jgi:hypothetical protein
MTDPITRDPAHAPQGTYDGRPAQRTLRSPEQRNSVVGGDQLTGPTDEEFSPLHDGRPSQQTLRLKETHS